MPPVADVTAALTIEVNLGSVPGLKDVGCLEFMEDDLVGRPLKGPLEADDPLVGIDELGNTALSDYLKKLVKHEDVCRVVLDVTDRMMGSPGHPDRRHANVRIILGNMHSKSKVQSFETLERTEYYKSCNALFTP